MSIHSAIRHVLIDFELGHDHELADALTLAVRTTRDACSCGKRVEDHLCQVAREHVCPHCRPIELPVMGAVTAAEPEPYW